MSTDTISKTADINQLQIAVPTPEARTVTITSQVAIERDTPMNVHSAQQNIIDIPQINVEDLIQNNQPCVTPALTEHVTDTSTQILSVTWASLPKTIQRYIEDHSLDITADITNNLARFGINLIKCSIASQRKSHQYRVEGWIAIQQNHTSTDTSHTSKYVFFTAEPDELQTIMSDPTSSNGAHHIDITYTTPNNNHKRIFNFSCLKSTSSTDHNSSSNTAWVHSILPELLNLKGGQYEVDNITHA